MALQSTDIVEFLKPFRRVVDRKAMAVAHRALALDVEHIRGMAPFAKLEVRARLGLESLCYVDGATFMAVMDSLPEKEDVEFATDAGALLWECGKAKGKMALLEVEGMDAITHKISKKAQPFPHAAAAALRLGLLSSGGQDLAAAGYFGVVLDPRDESGLRIMSTDNDTIAAATLPGVALASDDLVTISPEAAELLATVIGAEGKLDIGEAYVLYRDKNTRLLINRVAPLTRDVSATLAKFDGSAIKTQIPRDRINAFIKRSAALAENGRRDLKITLRVKAGEMAMAFQGATAMSDEYCLADNLKIKQEMSVEVHVERMARALSHVEEIILDYADRGILIFAGGSPSFRYLVAGAA